MKRKLDGRVHPELAGLSPKEYFKAHRKKYRHQQRRPFCDCGNPAEVKAADGEDICLRCKALEDTRKMKLRKMQEHVIKKLDPFSTRQRLHAAFFAAPPERTGPPGWGSLVLLDQALAALRSAPSLSPAAGIVAARSAMT